MSKLTIYDMKGGEVGMFDIADDLLEMSKGKQAVHDVVVACLAGRRSGSASTLSKGEVAGSNKKPWRQKGTGRARAGYRQSPVWRGGAVAFGPRPRDYSVKVNKKVAKLAFKRAFSDRVADGNVRIVEKLTLEEPKTALFVSLLKALGIKKSALFITGDRDKNLILASRNVENVAVVNAMELSAYDLVRYPVVVLSKSGMETVKARLSGQVAEAGNSGVEE